MDMSVARSCSERSTNRIRTSMTAGRCTMTTCVRPSQTLSKLCSNAHKHSCLFVLILLLLYACELTTAMVPERCLQPRPSESMCAMPSFYYSEEDNECYSFLWTCTYESDANSFPTLEDCQTTCVSASGQPVPEATPTAPPTAPAEVSVTMGEDITTIATNAACLEELVNPASCSFHPLFLPKRFFFDQESQTCEQFSFFGCEEGANNFQTLEDCVATCIATEATPSPTNTFVESTMPSNTHMTSGTTTTTTDHMTDHMTASVQSPTTSSANHMTNHATTSISVATRTPVPTNYPTTESSTTPSEITSLPSEMTSSSPEITSLEPSSPIFPFLPTTNPITDSDSDIPTSTPPTTTELETTSESDVGTEPTQEGDSDSSTSLSVFDYASVAIGLVAFLLILILLGLLAMVTYRYRRRLRRDSEERAKRNKPYLGYSKNHRHPSLDHKGPAVMQRNCCYETRTCFKHTHNMA